MQHDLIIRNGTLVDGTGAPPRRADVAVHDGRISAVGSDLGSARETVDADGLLVTPGFIDVHTHYDGQVMWDTRMAPIVWHGITTAVVGNCGVGFAPARPADRDYLVNLMASVEDIPADALAAGLGWNWETYPQYLDAIAARGRTVEIASMITHCSLRRYVMGEGAHGAPTDRDIAAMAELVREGMRAGAVGLSTSRTILHTTLDGRTVPATDASEAELTALARAVREGGGGTRGILEVSPPGVTFAEPVPLSEAVQMLIRVARGSGCPVVFSLLQSNYKPDEYLSVLALCAQARAEGVHVYPEVGSRPIAVLLSFQSLFNPFASLPSYAPLREMEHAQRVAALRDPALRARLLTETNATPVGLDLVFTSPGFWSDVFLTGTPFNYYPRSADSVQARADAAGVDPRAIAYDAMLERDGSAFLMYATNNWLERNRDALHAMITHPCSVIGLADGGAHVTVIADSSQPTTLLASWVRDAHPGDDYRLPVEQVVHKLSLANARVFGLPDRGAIAPGLRADINLIDLAALAVGEPCMEHDLPLGRPRLEQRARGYVSTWVGGVCTQRDGVLTGAIPGGLARGG